jgi:hypothetical protein
MIGSAFHRLSTILVSVVALAGLISGVAHATTTSIVTLTATRMSSTGKTVTVPLLKIDNTCSGGTTCTAPVATLILFAGDDGRLHLLESDGGWQGAPDLSTVRLGRTQNFLVRERNSFAGPTATDTTEPDLTFNVIMMDVPSDHTAGYPLSNPNGTSFRRTASHQSDIADVIAYARTTFSLPVWLIGTSNGSTSAVKGALIATQQPTLDGPDGFVLTSTITLDGDANNVLDMPLKDIALVAMMVANEDDACPDSPPLGVNKIARNLTASPDFRGKFVTTDPGSPTPPAGEECQGDSYHGYWYSEGKAVDPIRAWISGHAQ